MKVLSLLFLIVITLCGVYSNSCFQSTGYTTAFTLNGFNIKPPGGASATSFYESGSTIVDFENQEMMVSFSQMDMSSNSVYLSELYMYGKTNTMYSVTYDQNNDPTCNSYTSNFVIPSGYPNNTSDLGPMKVGQFPTEILKITTSDSTVDDDLLYDFTNCAMVASVTTSNLDQAVPSIINMLFLNFVNEPSPIVLPSICTPSMSIKTNSHHRTQSPKLPLSLHQLLKSFN